MLRVVGAGYAARVKGTKYVSTQDVLDLMTVREIKRSYFPWGFLAKKCIAEQCQGTGNVNCPHAKNPIKAYFSFT